MGVVVLCSLEHNPSQTEVVLRGWANQNLRYEFRREVKKTVVRLNKAKQDRVKEKTISVLI